MDDLLRRWIDGYVRAWNSNDPAEIGALFAEDATYRGAPYGPAVLGRDAITRWWLAHRDSPGETSFEWTPVSVGADVAVVEGTTTYPNQTFSNLWVIRLTADGRCREFTEWWMEHPGG